MTRLARIGQEFGFQGVLFCVSLVLVGAKCALGPGGHLAEVIKNVDGFQYPAGGLHRNGRAVEEIRKICDLATENHMFLHTLNVQFSMKSVGNSRVAAVTARIRRNSPAGSGLPERGGQPEVGCQNEVRRDREARGGPGPVGARGVLNLGGWTYALTLFTHPFCRMSVFSVPSTGT